MIVELLARPQLVMQTAINMGYIPHPEGTVSAGDELAEIAGRQCYEAWLRQNPKTATNAGYHNNIQEKKHYSIFEHPSFSFSVRDVSRSLTHEFIRHRHLSPSMRSQRYVDESKGGFVVPPSIGEDSELGIALMDVHQHLVQLYEDVVRKLQDEKGLNRKQAREAARAILPNGHTTSLVMSGNVHAWRDFLDRRLATDATTGEPFADLEIFELAQRVLYILHQEVPNIMQDVWNQFMVWVRFSAAAKTLAIESVRG